MLYLNKYTLALVLASSFLTLSLVFFFIASGNFLTVFFGGLSILFMWNAHKNRVKIENRMKYILLDES